MQQNDSAWLRVIPFAAKSRRARADFPGAKIILDQISAKPARRRVGFLSKGPPARGTSTFRSLQQQQQNPFFNFYVVFIFFFVVCFHCFSFLGTPFRQILQKYSGNSLTTNMSKQRKRILTKHTTQVFESVCFKQTFCLTLLWWARTVVVITAHSSA